MKNFFSILVMILFFSNVGAQALTDALVIKDQEFSFGSIPQGKPVYHVFEIENRSNAPLKLDNIQASCGCTTPEWSKDPIAPGAKATIKVGYNAAAEGQFEKSVIVSYNGNSTKQIIIKGNVWKAPVGSAPSNPSINFLKQQMK